jgi:putative thioredoxin
MFAPLQSQAQSIAVGASAIAYGSWRYNSPRAICEGKRHLMMTNDDTFTVTPDTFEQRVIERSAQVPVVVDFWAPWCGPCRVLGPTLERLARAAHGAWELAKLDIDQAPALAQRYRVQSIPAVKGFRDGQVVAEFLGAQPESAVRAFLQRLVPSEADRGAAEAARLFEAGDFAGAEQAYRAALAQQPDHPKALLGLAQILMGRGDGEAARPFLEAILPNSPESRQALPLLGQLRFQQEAATLPSPPEARQILETNPDDPSALWALGVHAAAGGAYDEALERFLTLAERHRRFGDDAGRKAMISVFDILGPEHTLTRQFRPRLAAALY